MRKRNSGKIEKDRDTSLLDGSETMEMAKVKEDNDTVSEMTEFTALCRSEMKTTITE